MRVLFSAVPAAGHLFPMLPLARAARDAGDEVVVATHASLSGLVGDLPFVPVGPDMVEVARESARRHGGVPHTTADVEQAAEMFCGTRVDLTLDAATDLARDLAPDAVVADSLDTVAPLVAARLGVPWGVHEISIEEEAFRAALEDGLAGQLRAHGLGPVERAAHVSVWPSWLQPEGHVEADDTLAVRAEAYTGGEGAPAAAEVPHDGGRPAVLLTLGTVVRDAGLLRAVLAQVLAGGDVDVVVTAPPGADLGPLDADPRVRPVGFAPLARLLPGVAAVVGLGGAGTVLASLRRGVPLVLMPVMAEQPASARAVAAAGAAVVARGPHEVGAALARVLSACLGWSRM